VLSGDALAAGDSLPRLDDPRLDFAIGGSSRTVRRTWFDTFDWRLFRAGLTLELVAERGGGEFVLTGRDGDTAAAAPAGGQGEARIRFPCLVEALPLGQLREHLAPVTGVRALLPIVKATSSLREYRALNADEKTVAVVTVERMTVTQPRHRDAGARLTVRPLRGYDAQAAKLADSLSDAPGVEPAATTAFESALKAVDRKPGDYTGKIDVRLTAEMPAAFAVAAILDALFDTVEVNLPGTIRDIDTEFLHDLRVAVRRTRSVLKLAGSVLPDATVSRYAPEFKWLGDLTTPTRDGDVYLLSYPAMAAQLVAATPDELAPFHDYLAQQRAAAFGQLARGLRGKRFAELVGNWRLDLDKISAAPRPRPPAGAFAARRITTAHQKVLRRGAMIGPDSPSEALHDLRKRCKELRYLLEVFASLHDPSQQWHAIREMKALQDCLGEYQDTQVQHAGLHEFAARMMGERRAPAATLLAMGEIAAKLAERANAARREFAGRFAEFASPRGQARIAALTKAGT